MSDEFLAALYGAYGVPSDTDHPFTTGRWEHENRTPSCHHYGNRYVYAWGRLADGTEDCVPVRISPDGIWNQSRLAGLQVETITCQGCYHLFWEAGPVTVPPRSPA